jgi:predicted small integral membrane protein
MLLITGFLLWTPISIRRNIVVHASLYSVYFLISAAVIFLRNIKGEALAEAVGFARLSLNAVCLLLWILLLNKRGEEIVMVVRSRWRPADEIRLARQMDAVNAFLLKPSSK